MPAGLCLRAPPAAPSCTGLADRYAHIAFVLHFLAAQLNCCCLLTCNINLKSLLSKQVCIVVFVKVDLLCVARRTDVDLLGVTKIPTPFRHFTNSLIDLLCMNEGDKHNVIFQKHCEIANISSCYSVLRFFEYTY